MEKAKFKNYIIIVAVIIITAVLGSIFVNLGIDWFSTLYKPSDWIPNIVIPIVWTIIYILFAISFCYMYSKNMLSKSTIVWGIINCCLNVLWCLIFFTLRQKFLGNIAIILNLIAGIILLLNFYKNSKVFGYILLIYAIWLSIATTLNSAIWILN